MLREFCARSRDCYFPVMSSAGGVALAKDDVTSVTQRLIYAISQGENNTRKKKKRVSTFAETLTLSGS